MYYFTLSLCLCFSTVQPQRDPQLTSCVSANMETFRCRWNVGTLQNLSKPGELRLFYINKL